jgi:hypothetical protein
MALTRSITICIASKASVLAPTFSAVRAYNSAVFHYNSKICNSFNLHATNVEKVVLGRRGMLGLITLSA